MFINLLFITCFKIMYPLFTLKKKERKKERKNNNNVKGTFTTQISTLWSYIQKKYIQTIIIVSIFTYAFFIADWNEVKKYLVLKQLGG